MAFIWPEYRYTGGYTLMPSSIFGIDADNGRTPSMWSKFSESERSVYPVLCSHQPEKGCVTMCEDRIAALAGLKKRETARIATDALDSRGLISVTRSPCRRHTKKYKIVSVESERMMPFYRDMIYSGTWASIGKTPTAQALYLSMRYLAKPRPDLDDSASNRWPRTDDEFREYMMERTTDFCLTTQHEMIAHAGISRRSFPAAVSVLKCAGLVSRTECGNGYAVRLW